MTQYRVIERHLGVFKVERKGLFGWSCCDLIHTWDGSAENYHVTAEAASRRMEEIMAREAHRPRVVLIAQA